MLTNPQKSLIKRAQCQAGLSDEDYREVLESVTGCRSSTDPRLDDLACDKILAYMEAIFWRKVDQGKLQPTCKPNAVFLQRWYWATKNTRFETSRDRYTSAQIEPSIAHLERSLASLGFGPEYVNAIRENVTKGRNDVRALFAYRTALERTLRAKEKKAGRVSLSA